MIGRLQSASHDSQFQAPCRFKVTSVVVESLENKPVFGRAHIPSCIAAFDAKLIRATNRNPAECVKPRQIRRDSLCRIATFVTMIPPLRETDGDIPLLIEFFLALFLAKASHAHPHEVSDDVLGLLCTYGWPGNIRELRTVTEGLVPAHGGVVRSVFFKWRGP